jgi:hypothetical protein
VNKICEETKESEWYQCLQTELKDAKNSNFEEIFKTHAEKLMSQYALTNGSETFLFKEIEYYFYDKDRHPDPYVHGSCKQKEAGKYYYHYSGLDITFGDGNYSGGILIRAICRDLTNKEENEECIIGPKNSVKRMLHSELNGETYKYSNKNTNKYNIKICKLNSSLVNNTVYVSTRIRLNESICDNEAIFRSSFYRFVRKDLFDKNPKELEEKTKLIIINDINGQREKQIKYLNLNDKCQQKIWKKIEAKKIQEIKICKKQNTNY